MSRSGSDSESDSESDGDYPNASHVWRDDQGKWRDKSDKGIYKHKQQGKDGERYTRDSDSNWVRNDCKAKPKGREITQEACRGAITGVARAGEAMMLRNGVGVSAMAGTSTAKAGADTHVTDLAGLKVLSAGAEAKTGNASAGAMATPIGAQAFANANGAEASANAALVEDLIEAKARAVAAEAQANAGFGVAHLGAYAGASVTTAKVEVGLSNIPLANASAEGPGAGADAGVSWKYTGASAGAHFGEAKAGPFGVRAGVKFGAGIRNGIPEVDLGPVTAPCSVM